MRQLNLDEIYESYCDTRFDCKLGQRVASRMRRWACSECLGKEFAKEFAKRALILLPSCRGHKNYILAARSPIIRPEAWQKLRLLASRPEDTGNGIGMTGKR